MTAQHCLLNLRLIKTGCEWRKEARSVSLLIAEAEKEHGWKRNVYLL